MTYLQIVGAEIVLCFLVCVGLCRRTGLFSPASTSASFCLACMIFEFVVSWSQIDLMALRVGGIAFPITASQEADLIAVHIYAFVILLTWCSAWGIRKINNKPLLTLDNNLFKNTQKLAQRTLGFHSLLAPIIFVVVCIHCFVILLPNIDNYYFTDRSNIILAPLLLVSMLLAYYTFRLPQKLYFFLYLISFFYTFAIMLGAYSRIIPLTFIIITICIAADTAIKKSWVRHTLTGIFALLSVFFLVYSLAGRKGRDEGLNYALVWQAMQDSVNPANSYILIAATANVFHGVLLTAECIDTTGAHYSSAYQLLSLSPFPSFVDGWDQVVDEQIRLNIYTPFSTFGEAYFFAPAIQLALAATYLICVRTMTRFYARNIGWRRIFITAFSLFCWAIMHQYPVRNMFRILLLAAVLCVILRVRPPKTKVKMRGRALPGASRGAVPAMHVPSGAGMRPQTQTSLPPGPTAPPISSTAPTIFLPPGAN